MEGRPLSPREDMCCITGNKTATPDVTYQHCTDDCDIASSFAVSWGVAPERAAGLFSIKKQVIAFSLKLTQLMA